VYTHEGSNFVVKYMRDTDTRRLNGKYRWYPELLNHRLAWRLCPERTMAMYAAYMGVEDDSYFFVYERGRNLSSDEELSKLSEALQVIEQFNGLGLLHLDTKLSNFLVNASGNVCLHDWGMALPVDHGIPGDLMYSDPFGDDASLWKTLSEQAGGRRYPDVILQWTRMCQGRLLLAKIEEAPRELGEYLTCPAAFRDFTAGVGLGLDNFYNSPVWFRDFHSVLCGFSATIVSRSYYDLFGSSRRM
jgi:serine/threonine protein kinase